MLHFFKKITHLLNLEFVAGRADQVHKAKPVSNCNLKAIPCLKKKKYLSRVYQALLINIYNCFLNFLTMIDVYYIKAH